MVFPFIIYWCKNHHAQWNCVTWLDNLNAKWIGLWSKQKASVVLDMHCSQRPFDQIWSSCEPYIVILCWNWSFILFTFINWNKCIVFEVCFWKTSTLKSPKRIVGQMMKEFDISFSTKMLLMVKMGSYKLQLCEFLDKCSY